MTVSLKVFISGKINEYFSWFLRSIFNDEIHFATFLESSDQKLLKELSENCYLSQ